MVTTIRQALAQVKDDLPGWIETGVEAYLAQHPELTVRRRQLDPLTTVLLFIMQVLHGNTAITHLRHLARMTCSATAYCKARMRLPLALLQYLAQRVTAPLLPEADHACDWRGHRVWYADGTSFSMPDTAALQAHFGQPGGQASGCGFPVATLLLLCNAAGFIVKTLALPLRTHEASQVARLHDPLQDGDVLVYDRAACSYAHLALLAERGLHAIFRVHQKQIVNFRPGRRHAGQYPRGQRAGRPRSQWLKRLGHRDQRVRWFRPARRPQWMQQDEYDALPEALVVRELRYPIVRRGFRTRSVTLVTTLTDPQRYPAEALTEQYLKRWQIEVNIRHLKQTMGMDVLKCQTVDGVLKELAVFTLVYNLVRLVISRAARRQGVPPDRISFVDALRWLCQASYDPGRADQIIDLVVNPHRPGRVEPREVKRRPKPYKVMTSPRQTLKQALASSRLTA